MLLVLLLLAADLGRPRIMKLVFAFDLDIDAR